MVTLAVVSYPAEPDYAPTHYVVRWESTGLCTVVRERPPDPHTYATVWTTTFRKVAERKAVELKDSGRCNRTAKPREHRFYR